ncbi:hypothetical protein GCM10023321_19380 [Pseudonocardia eucalypti]|uniref:Uncharacterized protein n=1 Tax=Pseudonocardia eucalypti TaxID=648755 RepID=A0ABP9PT99_9PSEU
MRASPLWIHRPRPREGMRAKPSRTYAAGRAQYSTSNAMPTRTPGDSEAATQTPLPQPSELIHKWSGIVCDCKRYPIYRQLLVTSWATIGDMDRNRDMAGALAGTNLEQI